MRNGIWLLVGTAPELKGWRTLLRIDDFWEVWRSGQSVIIWYPSCLLEICFFRGVRTGKMWLIPHLSFFLLVLVFQALVLQGTRICTLLVLGSFLILIFWSGCHRTCHIWQELLIYLHLLMPEVPAESLLSSSGSSFLMETCKCWGEPQRLQTLQNPSSRRPRRMINFLHEIPSVVSVRWKTTHFPKSELRSWRSSAFFMPE